MITSSNILKNLKDFVCNIEPMKSTGEILMNNERQGTDDMGMSIMIADMAVFGSTLSFAPLYLM